MEVDIYMMRDLDEIGFQPYKVLLNVLLDLKSFLSPN